MKTARQSYDHETQHVEQVLHDFSLVERVRIVTPPLADEDEEFLDGILGVTHYARGYGMTRHFVHLLLVGHHGEENLGCVHHSVVKSIIIEEVEEMLQKVLLPVCLDDSTGNGSKQNVLGTNLNEVGKHVECGFNTLAMNR